MQSRLQRLAKDCLSYGIGGAAAKGVAALLLPIYTRLFEPAQFGMVTLVIVLGGWVGTVLAAGTGSAQSYFYFEQKNNGPSAQAEVIMAVLQWRVIWGAVVLSGLLLLWPYFGARLFDNSVALPVFAMVCVSVLFGQLSNQCAEVLRLMYRPWSYTAITLSHAVGSGLLTVVFVWWLDWGISGFFAGSAIASLIVALVGWWSIRAQLDWSEWHGRWWPRLLRFGGPLVPAAFAMYALNTTDYLFVKHYLGLEALGAYAVGSRIAMVLALAVGAFGLAWAPVSNDALHSNEGAALFRTVGRLYLGFASACAVILALLAPVLVAVLSPSAYQGAYVIVGILAWQSVFYGFSYISYVGMCKKERTGWIPFAVGLAAAVNIALDAFLVPRYGAVGAAIATVMSFFVWIALTLAISERLWPVRHALAVLLSEIGIGIVASAGILSVYAQGGSVWQAIPFAVAGVAVPIALSVERSRIAALVVGMRRNWVKNRRRAADPGASGCSREEPVG